MGSRGDAYDNAVAETFFATLKKELVNRRTWPSRLELQSAMFEYIEAFYNRQRRHSTLGMVSPAEYEQTHKTVTSIKCRSPMDARASSEPGRTVEFRPARQSRQRGPRCPLARGRSGADGICERSPIAAEADSCTPPR